MDRLIDTCSDTRVRTCIGMFMSSRSVELCIDVCTDRCMGTCIETCMDTCMDMFIDKCTDMRTKMCIHVYMRHMHARMDIW